jgi:hypothetical protein
LFLPRKSLPVDTNQFVFFHQKINGIGQSDTGIDMFLYNSFITEWCVVQSGHSAVPADVSVTFARLQRATDRASPPAKL